MDQFLRVAAVLLEVLVLAGMMFCIFWGVKLLLVDLGINSKYNKAIFMVLTVLFGVFVFFFIMHLSSFYPVYRGS
jgi:hypothetical protein